MTDFINNSQPGGLEPRPPDDLVIDAIDERAMREARERNAARVRLLWQKRRFLVRAMIAGLVLATAVAFLLPNRYTSTAQLMPPNGGLGSGTGAAMLAALSSHVGGSLASMAESALGIKTTGALFIGILQSNTVRDDLIHKFDLQKVYGDRYLQDARKDLGSHTGISEDQKSGIISISVTDHNPHLAAAMAQEYVNELNWVVTHLNTSSAYRERVFLDQRLAQVKTNLEDAEKQFSQFASQKGAIDITAQGKAMVTAAATLQGQLIAAESELQGLRQIFTNNNVRVRAAEARVDKLRSSLEKLAGKGADENSSAQQLYPSLRQLPILGVTYADLYRRMKVEETVFETLTEQDEMAKVEEAKDTPSVKVLDPPLVPQKKSFPPRLVIMFLGTVLAFGFAASLVLAGSAWQAVDASDPRKVVALEVWSDVHAHWPWNGHHAAENNGAKRPLQEEFSRKQERDTGE